MFKIAISGQINTGKNTVSKILTEELCQKPYKKKAVTMAFADPIKEIVLNMFPNADRKCLFGSSQLRDNIIADAFKDEMPLTYRQALLDIGTQGKTYDNEIWIKNFHSRYHKMLLSNNPTLVIVSDCRFRNEFNYLKKHNFLTIRLYRNNQNSINHDSETKQGEILDSEFDHIIINNEPIKVLRKYLQNNIIPYLKQS